MAQDRRKPKGSLADLARIQDAPTAPVYFLKGDDPFLRDEYLRGIHRKIFGDAPDDFNHDRFDWAEADVSEIATVARTLPFMVERRLVEVLGFVKPDERSQSILTSYLEAPSESTVLVLCAENADMRTTFFRHLAAASVMCHVDTPTGQELTGWLRGRAGELGFELQTEAADMLVEMVQPSMARLSAELEKLASYVMPETFAGVEEVREIVGHSREELVYKLGDSISQGSLEETLILLRRMVETESPLMFIGLLRNLIRRWTISKALIGNGKGAHDISQALGVPPFVAQRLEKQVLRLRAGYLRDLYGKLLQVDRKLKRTSDAKIARQSLESFLVEMRFSIAGTQKVV